MGRVINTNSPGKRRNQFMRTCAEILRRLSQKQQVDDETRDMVAMLVYCLRAVNDTIEESVVAWEKRGYWKKADDFQQKWWWASLLSRDIESLIRAGEWDNLPTIMIKLLPYVSDIKINKMTRNQSLWVGCYQKILEENPRI